MFVPQGRRLLFRLILPVLGLGAWLLDSGCSSDGSGTVGGGGNPAGGGASGGAAAGSSATNPGAGNGGAGTTAGSGAQVEAGAGGEQEPGGPIQVGRTRTEYRKDPLGLDVAKPRLDWWLSSDVRSERQTAYQVLVASSAQALAQNQGDLWDSGKVMSDQSVQVVYAGKALGARGQAFWKVRVWDKDDVPSAYSKPARWELGLLAESDWSAKWLAGKPAIDATGVSWIWYPEGDPAASAPAGDRFFRKHFTLANASDSSSASCVLTADNAFKLYVNGKLIGSGDDWHQTPTFSIQSALVSGDNVIAIQATNVDSGAGVLGQCRVDLKSGAPIVASTDSSWKSANSAVAGWQNAGFDDSSWTGAKQVAALGGGPWGALGLGNGGGPAPYFRKAFTTKSAPVRARLYATALGIYELSINGKRVGLDHFAPGWTDYNKRVQVQAYDVTALVKGGDNALGAILGDGWYQGKVGFLGRSTRYGKDPAHLRVQLELEFDDGSKQTVASDDSWKTKTGPIMSSDNLDGEVYDARLEMPGWDSAGFDDQAWGAARVVTDAGRKLVGDVSEGVQVIQELPAKTVKASGAGSYVFDLGQNMVGWVRLQASAAAGTQATLRFAEVLNPDGSPYYTNMRGAKATDQYTFKGAGTETFEPHFTFHGFRYVEISGLPSMPALGAVTGVVAHSATPPTGTFTTSSELVNQLQSNIVWGQKGNFVSVPTDCPQRDERLGWMGDALIFVRTATFNMDVASFFTKWTRDVDDGQTAAGAFGDVSPSVFQNGTPAWGDAGTIVPWTIYLAYADTRILEEHYPAMVRWVEYIKGISSGNLWVNSRGSDYGDWLSIDDDTDKAVLATAFYAHSVDLVAKSAAVLHKDADAAKYAALFESIKSAFIAGYVGADGKVKSDSQTAYGLALRFNLLPQDKRQAAAGFLDANVVRHTNHLSTGFVGVSHLLPALSGGNKLDRAYQLLNNDTYPSWGYEIRKGATTIWERWDGIRENGQFQDPGMNSFNHYSFGSVGEWMYSTVGGIELDEAKPGYKHFVIRPRPGGGLSSAKAALDSIHGPIASEWKVAAGKLTLTVTIPVNTSATVYPPFNDGIQLDGAAPPPAAADGGYELGSGSYVFTVNAP